MGVVDHRFFGAFQQGIPVTPAPDSAATSEIVSASPGFLVSCSLSWMMALLSVP
jgi:hypothetical protein